MAAGAVGAAAEWVAAYDCHEAWLVFHQQWGPPVAATLCYVAFVFAGPSLVPAGGLKGLRPAFVAWNAALAAFSAAGFAACAAFVARAAADPRFGPRGVVCSDEMIWGVAEVGGSAPESGGACYGAAGLAAVCFTWSKFAELVDTVFLVLRGRPVEFLHWYHHLTVLLYCWFAFGSGTPSALLFGCMNYGVHAVMYTYYAVSQVSSVLRPLRVFVTSIQIAQMVMGVAIVGASAVFSAQGGCSASYGGQYFAFCGTMYASYLALFLRLFYASYIAGTRKGPKRKAD